MIAWILAFALALAITCALGYRSRAETSDGMVRETNDVNIHLLDINHSLRQELKRTGTHRDELLARYRDQEADREIKLANQALRSERARKASQARRGKRVA